MCSTGAGAAAAISTTGSAIGFSIATAVTGLALGGRPRRGRRGCSFSICVGFGSADEASGTIRLGRMRRGSGAAAFGSAAEGQNTSGRGAAGAVSRWGIMGRWRPPDLVSTVNDRGERLRMVL